MVLYPRGYKTITVVLDKKKNGSLLMVPTWTETCRSDSRNFNCFNIPVILWLCASLWNNKKCFDTVDARYKNEDCYIVCCQSHTQKRAWNLEGISNTFNTDTMESI
jgi:hypothetical protein